MNARRRIFIDANVLLYLLSSVSAKADIAEKIIAAEDLSRLISTQTIGEFANIARKKADLHWAEIRLHIDTFRTRASVAQVTQDDQDMALAIADRYHYSWWDSQMIATAVRVGAEVLYTEDLKHGQRIGDLLIHDPFR